MYKVYVDVMVKMSKDGNMIPQAFIWEDGREYIIDKILKVERCASRKAGGTGIMFTCMVAGQESHLTYEVDRFFMERKKV